MGGGGGGGGREKSAIEGERNKVSEIRKRKKRRGEVEEKVGAKEGTAQQETSNGGSEIEEGQGESGKERLVEGECRQRLEREGGRKEAVRSFADIIFWYMRGKGSKGVTRKRCRSRWKVKSILNSCEDPERRKEFSKILFIRFLTFKR